MVARLGLGFSAFRPRRLDHHVYQNCKCRALRYLSTQRPLALPLHSNKENCTGRVFIVTGANTGIGFEATKHLVAAGASKVVMAVRNLDSGRDAKAKIEAELGITQVAEVWRMDLSSYNSVKAFAARASIELDRVDGLIENAGVFDFKRTLAEGHLNTVTVNVISTFLLTALMLPKLSRTAQDFKDVVPHLTVVGSSWGFSAPKDWDLVKDDPLVKMDAEDKNFPRLYHLTKLINIMVVRQLGLVVPFSRLGVVVNVVSPGLSRTNLARHTPPEFQRMMAERVKHHGRTAEEGSRTLLHAAFAGPESHGRYLESCEIAEDKLPSWMTEDEGRKSQGRAWEVVTNELEAIEPGCLRNAVDWH
ncbi:hypothetical protein S40293_05965 [Stachybotrys chartarum IBT 40293]|nr:hypothetical protein S40293_05965 [Stachybotrys chartarum IBT 40293]